MFFNILRKKPPIIVIQPPPPFAAMVVEPPPIALTAKASQEINDFSSDLYELRRAQMICQAHGSQFNEKEFEKLWYIRQHHSNTQGTQNF